MAFTNIPNSDIDPGSPITTGLMTALRDNDEFLFTQTAGLVFIEKKLITSNVTTVTFSGLDGDTDEVYKLFGRIIVNLATVEFLLRPNGISTNQSSRSVQIFGTGGGSTTVTKLLLARGESTGNDFISFESSFWAKKNPNSIAVNRILQSQYGIFDPTAPATEGPGIVEGMWDETTVNVTSLDIVSSVASQIRDGSTIALYKLRQS